MEKGKKRERNVNFTREETERLISLIVARKNIIENKKSDAVTWQEKEQAWKAIETEFNSCGSGIFRDAKHLKLKFEAIKRDTRKKSSLVRAELYKTGGGPNVVPPLTPIEEKVKEIILLSVEGEESVYDSDRLDVAESEEANVEEPSRISYTTDHSNDIIILHDPLPSTSKQADIREMPQKRFAEWNPALYSDNIEVIEEVNDDVAATQVEQDVPVTPQRKWNEWKPASLKSKKHPALCKPKEKRPFEKLAEAKLEVVKLQTKLIQEELEEKTLKKQLLNDEIKHKDELHKKELEERDLINDLLKEDLRHKRNLQALEKEEMLLKINILKNELQTKNK